MDIFEIRHRNLMLILAALEARGVTKNKDQAQQLGALGASYLSQLKARKNLGDATARKIEVATRRPTGWMDQPQWIGHQQPAHGQGSQSMRLDPEIINGVARAMQDTADELNITLGIKDSIELFAELYGRVGDSGIATADVVWLVRRMGQGASRNARTGDLSDGPGDAPGKVGSGRAKG